MRIVGMSGLSGSDLVVELEQGGRFVVFPYCISVLVRTFLRPSEVYFIRPGENAALKGLKYVLITLLLGWWGIPSGPSQTILALQTNLHGGHNVTPRVVTLLTQFAQETASPAP
ncbi:MAG: hypothetical protein GXY76_01655 [Chloroflexi bacterium]|nr:hypothetical protein [Chloroflexota bacterium]